MIGPAQNYGSAILFCFDRVCDVFSCKTITERTLACLAVQLAVDWRASGFVAFYVLTSPGIRKLREPRDEWNEETRDVVSVPNSPSPSPSSQLPWSKHPAKNAKRLNLERATKLAVVSRITWFLLFGLAWGSVLGHFGPTRYRGPCNGAKGWEWERKLPTPKNEGKAPKLRVLNTEAIMSAILNVKSVF